MSKKEREISEFEMDLKFFGLHSNLSNDNIISARTGWHTPSKNSQEYPTEGDVWKASLTGLWAPVVNQHFIEDTMRQITMLFFDFGRIKCMLLLLFRDLFESIF